MKSNEIKSRFIEFFRKRGHSPIPSAPLVTADTKGMTNPTLFNTAGMQPLVPYLLGEAHPMGKRLVNSQKCLRTVDIDSIGDKTHATFFEMLGNWSLGDYFKDQAIQWSFEFLTSKEEGLGLDPARLYITVFEGDQNAPRDDEAAGIWKKVFAANGVQCGSNNADPGADRIFFMPAESNWWQAGENGPCGPDTEMYYDINGKFDGKLMTKEKFIEAECGKDLVEVWNDVFMQYEKVNGKITAPLPKPSVDTGAGLERLSMTLQNTPSIYETDLFEKLFAVAREIASAEKRSRIIADHIKASIFILSEGIVPSNTDRGYVLRRLIRRAVFNTDEKAISPNTAEKLFAAVSLTYGNAYPEIIVNRAAILKTFNEEVAKFSEALKKGTREFQKIAEKDVSGRDAFRLFSSYGLPIDLTVDLARDNGHKVDVKAFEEEFKKHQELSRSASGEKFKGGLASSSDELVIKYHTATHLLHQALHDVLGEGIMQKGSNITAERLRFDFACGEKITDTEKKQIEEIVNEKISQALPVNKVVLHRDEAEKTGARHFFDKKYGDEISIYFIGDNLSSAYSKEYCGGPHVKNTKELAGPEGKWRFKIEKEEAVARGIRRIRAVLAE